MAFTVERTKEGSSVEIPFHEVPIAGSLNRLSRSAPKTVQARLRRILQNELSRKSYREPDPAGSLTLVVLIDVAVPRVAQQFS